MIRYDLICADGHTFDGWFRDSGAYDEQARRGLVQCAVCGGDKVEKQLMAPRILDRSARSVQEARPVFSAPADPKLAMLTQMMREIKKTVEANAENVGERFPEVARQIHYNETEKRGIYGKATAEEARALVEEGIEVHPMPPVPEDAN